MAAAVRDRSWQPQQQQLHNYTGADAMALVQPSAGLPGSGSAAGQQGSNSGSRCHFCKETISHGDQFVRTDIMVCHTDCFRCSVCCVTMNGMPAFRLGSRICCQRCFRILTICAFCGGPIINGKSWVEFNNKAYHPHHFFCTASGCGVVLQFEAGFALTDSGEPVCPAHHPRAASCAVCGCLVAGEGVLLTDRGQVTVRHPECFMCSFCGYLLSWSYIIDQYGRPMCSEHIDMDRAFERINFRRLMALQEAKLKEAAEKKPNEDAMEGKKGGKGKKKKKRKKGKGKKKKKGKKVKGKKGKKSKKGKKKKKNGKKSNNNTSNSADNALGSSFGAGQSNSDLHECGGATSAYDDSQTDASSSDSDWEDDASLSQSLTASWATTDSSASIGQFNGFDVAASDDQRRPRSAQRTLSAASESTGSYRFPEESLAA